jgi:glycosyltransferase involved in cell wall biosynthesis
VVGSEGKGNFLAELKDQIEQRGLSRFFVFLGTRSDMREIYAISAVSLSLTSTTKESFGRAVVESLAIGTPVVGYAYGAVEETLQQMYPCGMVPVSDGVAVAQKVEKMLDSSTPIPDLSFTLKTMKSKTLALYAGQRYLG